MNWQTAHEFRYELAALSRNPRRFLALPESTRKNRSFLKLLVADNPDVYQYVPPDAELEQIRKDAGF